VGLYAVGRSLLVKAHAARISGMLQVLLGLLVLFDIVRRIVVGSEPVSTLMMGMGVIALIANVTCLILISRHREGEVHMRASWIFSRNDVIANLGVILAGGLVAWTGSRLPDLAIGLLVALIVIRGGILIRQDARETRSQQQEQVQ
jgi:Co/Zn/Cd efflux system component